SSWVVLGHWFVVAVVYRDGELSGYNALDVLTWIDPVTWLFQVMPIFFLVGGYASAASLASHRASGGDGIGWVLRRTDRLLRPTTALFVVLPVVTAVTVAAGVNKQLLGHAVWLASIPLWFPGGLPRPGDAHAVVVRAAPPGRAGRPGGAGGPRRRRRPVAEGPARADRGSEHLPVRLVGGLPARLLLAGRALAAESVAGARGRGRRSGCPDRADRAGPVPSRHGRLQHNSTDPGTDGARHHPGRSGSGPSARGQPMASPDPAVDRGRRGQRSHPDRVPLAYDSGGARGGRAVPDRCHGAAPDPLRGVAAVASAVDSVLHRHPRHPGRHLRPDRTAPAGAASRRSQPVARRRDRARIGRRAGRATRRCRLRPRLPRPHRAPMGCSDFVPVRCRRAARGTNPACSVGCHSLIAADYPALRSERTLTAPIVSERMRPDRGE